MLHHSENMDVELVEHTGLEVRRVLKKIRKQNTKDSEDAAFQLRRESEILRDLKNPGIPVIYDYWEDEEEICLIEEYIEGISLQEYVLRYREVDLEFIADLLQQILDIIVYLHGRRVPVMHQDLKAEHVIIRDGKAVLIDYGISEFLGREYRYDAASEDIHSLGEIIHMLMGHYKGYVPYGFRRMIRKACAEDTSARYTSAEEWRAELTEWRKRKSRNDKEGLLISNIAVVGNQRGIGTTHIAVSITSYLSHAGHSAYYINRSGRPGFLALKENLNTDFHEKDGIIYHKWFRAVPDYGPSIESQKTPDGICVIDCGTDFSREKAADIIIYVVGSRPWQDRHLMEDWMSEDGCLLMITPENPGIAIALARASGHSVVSMPYEENPMHPDRRVRRLYDQIFRKYKSRERNL